MKTIFAMLLLAETTLASAQSLLTCDNLPFSDLKKIELYHSGEGFEVTVQETSYQGKSVVTELLASFETVLRVKLSPRNGYERTFISDGENFYIESKDECTGSTVLIVCQ